MNARHRVLQTLPGLSFLLLLAGLGALAELWPRSFEQLMQEDGWAEWATFSAFVLAGVLGLRAGLRTQRTDIGRVVLIGLSLFCLFVAGEEISWGQRLLGFRPPELFLERNYQQESNLHNLFKELLDTRWMVLAIALAYGVLAPYLAYVFGLRRVAPALALVPWFATVAWLELSYPYALVGELAELLLGLTLLTDVIGRVYDPAGDTPARTGLVAGGAQWAAVVLGLLLLPISDFALRQGDDERIVHAQHALNRLASLLENTDSPRAKLFAKREVHKRLYTAVRVGYLELDPGQFYLDPWNSPYWFSFERTAKGRGEVRLYSLGPNRRRELDLRTRTHSAEAGDDIVVAFSITATKRAKQSSSLSVR